MLKKWKPAGPEYLPAPDWIYTQKQAAKAWKISWPDWKRLRLQEKVEMTGHELEVAKREGYIAECMKNESENKDKGNKTNSFMDQRRSMFAGRGQGKKK